MVILYSTSNGSIAVKELAAADNVLIGTFINAQAVAKRRCPSEAISFWFARGRKRNSQWTTLLGWHP